MYLAYTRTATMSTEPSLRRIDRPPMVVTMNHRSTYYATPSETHGRTVDAGIVTCEEHKRLVLLFHGEHSDTTLYFDGINPVLRELVATGGEVCVDGHTFKAWGIEETPIMRTNPPLYTAKINLTITGPEEVPWMLDVYDIVVQPKVGKMSLIKLE